MRCSRLAIFLSLIITVPAVAATLQPAFVFGDSMVLQRSMPVPVWGTGDAGASVSVDFAGQHHTCIADQSGHWKVTLDAMPTSAEPRDLMIRSGTTIDIHDVLVGEVWLAAGQSNMEFPLSREAHAAEEIPKADQPNVRLLNLSFAGQYIFGKPFGPAVLNRLTPDAFYSGQWARCTGKSAKPFSAIGYYFARDLNRDIAVPIGVINMSVGGSPTEAWIRRDAMANDRQLAPLVDGNWLDNPELDDWCKQRGRENLGDSSATHDPAGPNHPFKPGFLWDAGVERLIPFPIRGAIWYQGESNSLTLRRMLQHESLFRTLVADWRSQWGLGDFQFLYCQLSGIETANYKSQYWPEFRDQQRRLSTHLPNTGMVVTSDYGNPTDVHPREKREIARRLSLGAMALAYSGKDEWEGPLVEKMTVEGSSLLVSFTHADGLTTTDHQPLRGFEIAGVDGRFASADAKAVGSSILLTSAAVTNPVSVRYDWQPFPDGNVVNSSGLPCSTFTLNLAGSEHAR